MLLAFLVACRPTDSGDSVSSSFALTQVRYSLTWSADLPQEHPDGGWLFENDSGYEIHLREGYLVSYSLRLHPCKAAMRFWDPLISRAWAGHSDFLDPSNSISIAENLLLLEDIELQTVSFPETEYCEALYTIARADQQTQSLPENVDILNLSLWLKGGWQRDDQHGEFQLQTAIPAEELYDLSEIHQLGEGGSATFQVQRDLRRLFDSVDLDTQAESVAALQVLTNLSENAEPSFWLN